MIINVLVDQLALESNLVALQVRLRPNLPFELLLAMPWGIMWGINSIQLFYPSSGTSPQSPPPIQQGQVGMMGHCRQGPTCYRGHHSPLQQDTLTKPEANPLNPLGHCGGHSKRGLPRSHKTHKKADKSSRKTNQRRAGVTGRSKVGTVSYHQALCS